MANKNFKDIKEASLRPPVEDHQLADAPSSWAILDVKAYIVDCRNRTTAYGRMRNGVEIQVTFCLARPPVVSYFCFWCPEGATHLDDIGVEPMINTAEADLVIFGVGHGPACLCMESDNVDVFIYHPGYGGKGPSLRRIELDDPYCLDFNLGILRHRDITNPYDDQYHIASLVSTAEKPWQFILHLFDSRTETWSSQCVSVHGKQNQHKQFRFSPRKAIMLGQGGLMGFVDLRRGILICDVLDYNNNKYLHYLPFPRPLKDNKKHELRPVLTRDIVVVDGCVKVIDCFYCSAASAWKVSVWSMADISVGYWHRDYLFHVNNDLVDNGTLHLELLPNWQQANTCNSQQLLEALYITRPTLSLNDDKAYFMAKIDPFDKKACVLAVDLKNKRLHDVGVFRADRTYGVTLSYIHSRISQYLETKQGIKGNLKRLGNFLEGSSCKKQAGAPLADDMHIENDAASTEYEDRMDFD